jgi:hypothetical protein
MDPREGGAMNGKDPEVPFRHPITESLDLHTFRPQEVRELLEDYLEAAHTRGFAQVLVIHGKGTGVLRRHVRAILAEHPAIESFADAPAGSGGWGATVARLRGPEQVGAGAAPASEEAQLHEQDKPAGGMLGSAQARPWCRPGMPALALAGVFACLTAGLFYSLMLDLGGQSAPWAIGVYGAGAFYGFTRRATGTRQVVQRALPTGLIFGLGKLIVVLLR